MTMRGIVLLVCLLIAATAASATSLQSHAESLSSVQADATALSKLQALVERFHRERDESMADSEEFETDIAREMNDYENRREDREEARRTDSGHSHGRKHSSDSSVAFMETKAKSKSTHELHASAQLALHESSGGSSGGGGDFGNCKTCVFVLERIKKGTNMLLPAICSEIYISFPQAYAVCHQVLNALSLNGNNVRYWLFEGCYKYEIYQSKEWVKPCPSHVMCTVLKTLQNKSFCKPLPMEDPFKEDSAGGE